MRQSIDDYKASSEVTRIIWRDNATSHSSRAKFGHVSHCAKHSFCGACPQPVSSSRE